MTVKKFLLAAAMVAGLATGASAATLAGSSSGAFTSEDAGQTCTSSFFICFGGVDGAGGVNTSVLEWPGETFGNNHSNPARSSLTIENKSFNISPVPTGTADYHVGTLTWVNAASPGNVTPDNFNATANMLLSFTSPVIAGGSEGLSFNITNTVNAAGDDIAFSVSDLGFDFGFTLPTSSGNLTLNSFSTALLTGSAGSFFNGLWENAEGGTSSLGIYANITAAPVPLPAAGWLMIAGLGGLGALRRRKKPSAA